MKRIIINILRKNKKVFEIAKLCQLKLKESRGKIGYIMGNHKQDLSKRYFGKFNQYIDWENPKTLSEKLQCMKFSEYKDNEIYTTLADKYEVRSFVKERIGEKYLNDIYGVYDDVKDIDIETLPDEFVMKTNHGCATNVLCFDKKELDWRHEKFKLKNWMKINYFYFDYEYQYKNIKPKIICERLMKDEINKVVVDYKFYCFNGEPLFMGIDFDRLEEHKRNIYDMNFNLLPFSIDYNFSDRKIEKPQCFEEMIELARKLSKDFNFVRVDFYEENNKVVFGELTFTPVAGFLKFNPIELDAKFGEMIESNTVNNV